MVNGAVPASTYIGGTLVANGIQDRPASGGILKVGANAVLSASNSGKDRAIGVAMFSDGSNRVILDKTI
ncbi:MAG: hypothetical protein ABFC71_06520 [Methanoregula sp.]